MVTAKAPGKLYVAGEYAVVETGYSAILVAVNKFITINIESSEKIGTIHSEHLAEDTIHWSRDNSNRLIIDTKDAQFEYIVSAIRIVEKYVSELGKELLFYNLTVDSELGSKDGRKIGLGSSAAVTVATVKALGMFYDLKLSNEEIYKLASIAHLTVQGNGSLGDIAASTYMGWISYSSPDRNWIFNALENDSISSIVKTNWPELKIKPINVPADIQLLVGWTGLPASTSILVDQISLSKARKSTEYHEFLESSEECVQNLVTDFESNEIDSAKNEIRNNRKLLNELAEFTNVSIETPKLSQLIDIADNHGAASKTSGAGGGDCGIAIVDKNHDNINAIQKEWEENHIENLPLNVYSED